MTAPDNSQPGSELWSTALRSQGRPERSWGAETKYAFKRRALLPLSLAALILSACGFVSGSPPTPENTLTPTVTATHVPPTATPTAEPTATLTATPDLAATEQVIAAQTAEAYTAEIDQILQAYGRSTNAGHLGWSQSAPEPITASGGGRTLYSAVAEGQSFSNYVLYTHVAWESEVGAAGCGLMFHSERNFEEGQQYRFYTLRLSGLPAWDVELWEFNNWQATVTGDIKYTSAIDQANGATNEYILIAEGATLTVYINGVRVGTVTIATRSEGQIAFFTWQQSGQTTCTFEDTWIWEFDQ